MKQINIKYFTTVLEDYEYYVYYMLLTVWRYYIIYF